MTALANSLLRIWSAKSRSPRLTGRGWSGAQETANYWGKALLACTRMGFVDAIAAAKRTAPNLVVIVLRFCR